MKKLFLVIFLLLFTTNAYTQTVTTNYDFRIPNEGSRDWNEIISSDIISIDKIFTIISDDIQNLPGTGDMTKAVYDANEDGYIDDAAGGFGIANGFTMVSDDILSVSRDRVSTDAYLTGLTADSISTDVISADIIVLNNIYFPINDSPADNEIIKYDASLGRLAYEEDAGGTGYWSTDNDVIYPTNLGYTVSIDRIDGHIITCDILTADIISCDRLTADIISVDTISADKLLIDSLEYPTGIPNEGDILTYDVVTKKMVFSNLIPIMSSDIGLNTTHRGSDGSDHSYIDQDVTSGSAPTFTADNFSDGGSNAIVTTTQETNWDYNRVSTDAVLTALTSDIISCDRLTADAISCDRISADIIWIGGSEFKTVKQKSATLLEPDQIFTLTKDVIMFPVEAYDYSNGISISQIRLAASESVTLANCAVEEWTTSDWTTTTVVTVDAISLSGAAEATETTISNPNVEAGNYVVFAMDNTDINSFHISVWYDSKL